MKADLVWPKMGKGVREIPRDTVTSSAMIHERVVFFSRPKVEGGMQVGILDAGTRDNDL